MLLERCVLSPHGQRFSSWCLLANTEQLSEVWATRAAVWCRTGSAVEKSPSLQFNFPLLVLMKEWQKLPAGTGSDTATHWFQFSEGADEAFHSDLWPFQPLIGHVGLPYSLVFTTREVLSLPKTLLNREVQNSEWIRQMEFQHLSPVILPQDPWH